MKVRDVMSRKIVTLSPHTSYEEAARILYGNNVSGAPVVNLYGDIVGVISEKDLFRAMFPLYKEYLEEPENYWDQERQEDRISELRWEPIEKYMTKTAVTVDVDAPILRAGGLMLAYNLHRLPVTESGKLIGIVSREDIFRKILQYRLLSLLKRSSTSYAKTHS